MIFDIVQNPLLSDAAEDSVLMEAAKLVSFRGLFEFDDVMHNALGTAVGVLIVRGIRRLVKRWYLLM